MYSRISALCCACAAFWLPSAMAQQAAGTNPTYPRAAVAPPQYQSAFTDYQSFRDEKLASWREINDEAARVGGHLGIFMGGAHAGHVTPAAPATTAQQPPQAMPGKGHQGMTK